MIGNLGGLAATSYGSDNDRPALVLLHGLTYDRRQWEPALAELANIDPDRRVVALDLPGHGGSPRRDSYHLEAVAAAIHNAVTEAGLDAPVIVGHSAGGLLATVYSVLYPASGVVNVDQPLETGAFGELVRANVALLRSPGYLQFWQRALDGMHIELLPTAAQDLVMTATTPRQDLLLGYWDEIITTDPDALAKRIAGSLAALRAKKVPYLYVAGGEPDPAYRQWLQSQLPSAEITVLPDSGHFPHLAHPAEFAKVLAQR